MRVLRLSARVINQINGSQSAHQSVSPMTQLTHLIRLGGLVTLGLALVFGLGACTFVPGMTAHYYKSAIVEESPEVPSTLDYTLVDITPLLIQRMTKEREENEKKLLGTGPFPTDENYVYRLGPFDVLRIFVWGNPDLSPVLTTAGNAGVASTPAGRVINEKGDVFFPLAGTIKASGLTITEFKDELTKRLSKYIKDPQVDVDVAAFRSKRIFVMGEIRTPGFVPITDMPMHITDLIGQVGGPTAGANLTAVRLTRGKVTAELDLDKLYFNGDVSVNVMLQDKDVVTIPDRQSLKVFVLGEFGNAAGVNQARSYILRRGNVSLSEVIGDAGGLNPYSAAATKVFVMRADQNGEPIIYRLNAREPQSLVMTDNFMVQPRDVVYVSPTDLTEIGRFVGQFFPLTSAVQTVKNTPF